MTKIKDIVKPIEHNLQEFNKYLTELLKTDIEIVSEIINYQSKTKGKQIRPILVLLSSLLFDNINIQSYHAAGMVELTHTATLMHDDVIDEADKRRGLNTVNKVWNNNLAILVGDYYLAKTFITPIENDYLDFLKILINSIKAIINGELLQIQKSNEIDLDEDTYYKIINGKTASLIASSCELGAIAAGASSDNSKKLSEFGYNIGMAFQIRDDILDYVGNYQNTGKTPGNDLYEKKITLPLIFALNQADDKHSNLILKTVKQGNIKDEEVKFIIEFVINNSGIEYAQQRADEFIKKAIKIISDFPDSEAKNSLISFAKFISERNY